ncbi:MAG: hypothetical protein WAZ98_10855 [Cyclobacteriaceae bacterium]
MHLKPPDKTVIIVFLALLLTLPVYAQEDRSQQPDVDPTLKEIPQYETDPTLGGEAGNKAVTPAPAPVVIKDTPRDSDSVLIKQPTKQQSGGKVEKEADPLSFNFLYYIIEKFKLSDMIE